MAGDGWSGVDKKDQFTIKRMAGSGCTGVDR